jgi:hypothetical protein
MPDALQLLRTDHDRVKELFKRFENSDDMDEKRRIAEQAIMELDIHAAIEEEIFYPAVQEKTDDTDEILNEAEEEHHVAHLLIDELRSMRKGAKNFEAKFTVLAENVKHHIQEEESEMLPKAAEAAASSWSASASRWNSARCSSRNR